MTEQDETPEAPGQNPEVGISDLTRLLQAIAQAVLSGQTEIPAIHLRIVGKRVDLGPIPVVVR